MPLNPSLWFLVAVAFAGTLLLVWGIGQIAVWSVALALLGTANGARFGGYLVSGAVVAALGGALLFFAARAPADRGH